jgi:hypothetical protein
MWVRLFALGLLAASMPGASARADSMWEVAHARANARAGGPISGYDAEMLERWGCLSGTRSAFCRRVARGGKPTRRRAARRRSRR